MPKAKDAMGLGLRLLNRYAGLKWIDRMGARGPSEAVINAAARAGFASAGAASRMFKAVSTRNHSERPANVQGAGLFDLSLSDEQEMFRDTCRDFAAEQLRPAALDADTHCETPAQILSDARDLGIHLLGVPESLGGVGNDRSAMTHVLVTEALAHGDLGMAWACLAPSAVANALALWGNAEQQSVYLPEFVGEQVPAAALAIQEPTALFDPFRLKTTARRTPSGYVLEGTKSLVPLAVQAEVFVIAAHVEGRGPALFIVESSSKGLSVRAEPAMGLRSAATGSVQLDQVQVPFGAQLANGSAQVYADCINLSRLGWCALSLGAAHAALDYLVPYVNERSAFGEPISHRQAVAFSISDMAIELEGMRLLTYRAASRAEQGLDFHEPTALARRLCADKGMQIGSDAVQLLGGHGFVKEHPAERWYRDLRAVGFMEGGVLV